MLICLQIGKMKMDMMMKLLLKNFSGTANNKKTIIVYKNIKRHKKLKYRLAVAMGDSRNAIEMLNPYDLFFI